MASTDKFEHAREEEVVLLVHMEMRVDRVVLDQQAREHVAKLAVVRGHIEQLAVSAGVHMPPSRPATSRSRRSLHSPRCSARSLAVCGDRNDGDDTCRASLRAHPCRVRQIRRDLDHVEVDETLVVERIHIRGPAMTVSPALAQPRMHTDPKRLAHSVRSTRCHHRGRRESRTVGIATIPSLIGRRSRRSRTVASNLGSSGMQSCRSRHHPMAENTEIATSATTTPIINSAPATRGCVGPEDPDEGRPTPITEPSTMQIERRAGRNPSFLRNLVRPRMR